MTNARSEVKTSNVSKKLCEINSEVSKINFLGKDYTFSFPKMLEANVELEIRDGKLYAFSKKKNTWIELADNWWIATEYGSQPHEYYLYEKPGMDTLKKYSEEEWKSLTLLMRNLLTQAGYMRVQHKTTVLSSYAYTKAGHAFKNFRRVNGKIYADVYSK